MGQLENMINSVLQNPEEMKKVMEIANNVMTENGGTPDTNTAPEVPEGISTESVMSELSNLGQGANLGGLLSGLGQSPGLGGLMSGLGQGSSLGGILSGLSGLSGIAKGFSGAASKLLGSGGSKNHRVHVGGSDKTELLKAMKPWLSEERGQKLERAMKVAKVMNRAGSVFIPRGD